MGTMASQITSLTIVYSTLYSGADQRKHQSSASLAFLRGIHQGPVNSTHKWPVTWKCFHLMTSSTEFHNELTHWGWDKMAAIFQTTFSNAFSWMKIYKFRLRFHLSLFPRVQLTIFRHCFSGGLAPSRRQAIIWSNDGYFTDAYMCHSAWMS